jgi:hypothetical protein
VPIKRTPPHTRAKTDIFVNPLVRLSQMQALLHAAAKRQENIASELSPIEADCEVNVDGAGERADADGVAALGTGDKPQPMLLNAHARRSSDDKRRQRMSMNIASEVGRKFALAQVAPQGANGLGSSGGGGGGVDSGGSSGNGADSDGVQQTSTGSLSLTSSSVALRTLSDL